MPTLCKHCDHFVEENSIEGMGWTLVGKTPTTITVRIDNEGNEMNLCRYIHLENGEQEFDHNAEPCTVSQSLDEWKVLRPDLFKEHPDAAIGPNSIYHSQRGKRGAEPNRLLATVYEWLKDHNEPKMASMMLKGLRHLELNLYEIRPLLDANSEWIDTHYSKNLTELEEIRKELAQVTGET